MNVCLILFFSKQAAKNKDQPDASAHRQSVASFGFSTLELSKGASAGQKKMSMPPLTVQKRRDNNVYIGAKKLVPCVVDVALV